MTGTVGRPQTGVFYHGTSACHLPSILANGITRSFGAGSHAMAEVFGVPVSGIYVTDRLVTAAK